MLRARSVGILIIATILLASTTVLPMLDPASRDAVEPTALSEESNVAYSGKNAVTEWAISAGYQTGGTTAAGVVIPSDISSNSGGDVFVSGMLLYEAVFGQTRNNGQDQVGFVAKASASGQWQWMKAQTTHSGGGFSSYTAVESVGNDIYACGWYFGNLTFGGDQRSSSQDSQDIFVVKMNNNGDIQWSATAGSSKDDESCNDIEVDSAGNVFAIGEFNASSTASFGSHALTGSGETDIWVAKLSSSGAWQWATSAGGSSNDYGTALVNTGTDLMGTGTFTGTADFGTNQIQAIGQADLWVAHISTSGGWSNANQAGATGGLVQAFGIVEDNGTAYMAGELVGNANFGSVQANSSNNGQDKTVVVAALSSANQWLWASTATGYTTGRSIDLYAGRLLVAGSFASVSNNQLQQSGVSTFGSTTLSGNYWDAYAAVMDTNGNWLSADGSQGPIYDEGVAAIWRTGGTIGFLGQFCGGGVQSGSSCTVTLGSLQVSATGEHFSENYATSAGLFVWSMKADSDGDGKPDLTDNCPDIHNPNQSDIDSDGDGDVCDSDIDDDGLLNEFDDCDGPAVNWDPTDPALDRDQDGCRDSDEDIDDDGDGVLDASDLCDDIGDKMNWSSNQANDHDEDGCHDIDEDDDDDNDGIGDDAGDACPRGWWNWTSNAGTDHDTDGCADDGEDYDDDDDTMNDVDTVGDVLDHCPRGDLGWISEPATDMDADGCRDDGEDDDDDGDGVPDSADGCNDGAVGWNSSLATDLDGDGCRDADEDDDDDGDGVLNDEDGCAAGLTGWNSSPVTDLDGDGCADLFEDVDDDGDGVPDIDDNCPRGETGWGASADLDADGDGCRDATEDDDDDGDGVDDAVDDCPGTPLQEPVTEQGCGLYTQQDGDMDGVYDLDDDCLNTPDSTIREAEANTEWGVNVDQFGCWAGELDSDEDGMMNYLETDFCQGTPAGGIPDSIGCIPSQYDNDGDGVTGDQTGGDRCAWTSDATIRDMYGDFGGVDNDGCWAGDFDTDEDTVKSYLDRCPDTDPAIIVERDDENTMGCAQNQLDDDEDGVMNDADQCVATPASIEVQTEGEFAGCSLDQRLEEGDFAAMTEAYGIAIGGAALIVLALISLLVLMIARRGGSSAEALPPHQPGMAPSTLDPYVQQLMAQGYTAEVAEAAAAHYNEHSHGVQAAAGPPPMGASQSITYAQDYTKLPPDGQYQTDAYGTTIYHATDGSQWRMNPDQSFDRL